MNMCYIIKSLCYTPEANIVNQVYANKIFNSFFQGPYYHSFSPPTLNTSKQRSTNCCSYSVPKSYPTLRDPWTAAHQASLSSTVSWSLLKFTYTESAMLSHHLVPLPPLSPFAFNVSQHQGLFQRVGSVLCIRWPMSIL